MAAQTVAALKEKFGTGKTPTAQDYADLIDSFVHLSLQAAVNGQIIDQKIATYDTALKSRNQNGSADTLGDVFLMLAGIDDKVTVKSLIESGDFNKLANVPNTVPVQWTEQTITPNSNGSYQGAFTNLWLGNSPVPGISGKYLIADLCITRTAIPNTPAGTYADTITAIKLAISPTAKLK